jgi:SAM-dependent methyltransferase
MTRLDAPATQRNREPILAILRRWLASAADPALSPPISVLEIASGTGQHAVHFAQALPGLRWQPSDPDPSHLASIEAWRDASGLANVAAPIRLDVRDADWPVAGVDAIFNANMIHIAPWSAAEGLFAGAGRVLVEQGRLFLYGPFHVGGRPT